MAGSSGKSQTTTQTSEPPAYLKPFLERAANAAGAEFDKGTLPYPDFSSVVGFSPETARALRMTTNLATNNPLSKLSSRAAMDILSGKSAGGNPYLSAAINSAQQPLVENFQNAIAPSISSNFAKAGRFGSGQFTGALDAASQNLARELGDVSTSLSGQNFAQESSKQLQTLLASPNLSAAQYNDIAKLAGVGATREGLQQQQLQEKLDRYFYNPEAANISEFINLLNGTNAGGYGTTTNVAKGGGGSKLSQGLGIALGIGGLLSGNPMMAMSGFGSGLGNASGFQYGLGGFGGIPYGGFGA